MATWFRRLLTVALVAVGIGVITPSAAQAHNLGSSTISVHVTDQGVNARISVAVQTLDRALGTHYADATSVADYSDAVTTYLGNHLTVTGSDATVWAESWSAVTRSTVEGIDSLSTTVTFDTGTSDPSSFTIAYDAIIEAISDHEAVVVLTAADGSISTPGVITSASDVVSIGSAGSVPSTTGLGDMIGYGFHHVLEGADHLLFLATLLLVAPVVTVAGRWRRREGVTPTLRKALAVITSFTVGHSLTLIASSLGWITAPGRPVEVLIAVSVAVAAIHAIRPLARHGEEFIAAGFGLIHGLAFAGILADLGLSGSTSLFDLLAFNVGVELAQLTAAALAFPSLVVASRTRFYPLVRIGAASIALAAATTWALDRLGLLTNPLAAAEQSAIAHLPWIAAALAAIGAVSWSADRIMANQTGRSKISQVAEQTR